MKKDLQLMVTLWPSFKHFKRFSHDSRLDDGIRLNSAMIAAADLEKELAILKDDPPSVPLYFDIKGRQMRVTWVDEANTDNLVIRLNHPIRVKTPCTVLFKAGADVARLHEVQDDGRLLVFDGGPEYRVRAGESLYIRDRSLEVGGPIFTDAEKEKIEKVRAAGLDHWFLSYVEAQRDIDEFRELVGRASAIRLKIESRQGLRFVRDHWKKGPGESLVAARGDLYVEVDRPHQILAATRLIIEKDPEAVVGSRLLLSTIHDAVPSCADFCELAWLYDIGYRKMMLCDEMCLKEESLSTAVGAFEAFRDA